MKAESLRLLQQATRINPHAPLAAAARGETRNDGVRGLGEALIDVYASIATSGRKSFDSASWKAMLDTLQADPRTLGQFVDTPEVRALIRAQEAVRANP